MTILLRNATYIDWQSLEFRKTNIIVDEGESGKIQFFDSFPGIKPPTFDKTIDCEGKYVTKSFAVGHHHGYSSLVRGMPAPKNAPQNF